jgi:hypothetical protein
MDGSFESRDEVLEHFRAKYPKGTADATILAGERCEQEGPELSCRLPAPGRVASRHLVDANGRPASRGEPQEWYVVFRFDHDRKLSSIDAVSVSARSR